jgi:hypothetical protein
MAELFLARTAPIMNEAAWSIESLANRAWSGLTVKCLLIQSQIGSSIWPNADGRSERRAGQIKTNVLNLIYLLRVF